MKVHLQQYMANVNEALKASRSRKRRPSGKSGAQLKREAEPHTYSDPNFDKDFPGFREKLAARLKQTQEMVAKRNAKYTAMRKARLGEEIQLDEAWGIPDRKTPGTDTFSKYPANVHPQYAKNNPVAKDVRSPKYKPRVVKDKTKYTRKSKHKKIDEQGFLSTTGAIMAMGALGAYQAKSSKPKSNVAGKKTMASVSQHAGQVSKDITGMKEGYSKEFMKYHRAGIKYHKFAEERIDENDLKAVWKNTHRDYRSVINGKKHILALRDGGTTLVPLDQLTPEEIKKRAGRKTNEERIDETSYEKTKEYVKAARKDRDDAFNQWSKGAYGKGTPYLQMQRMKRRNAGIERAKRSVAQKAIDKLNKDVSEERIDEKAKSKAQQKLFGMALAMRRGESDRGSEKVASLAADLSQKKLRDFAKTKRKGLPDHVKKDKK